MATPSIAAPGVVTHPHAHGPAAAPAAPPVAGRDEQRMRALQVGLFTVGALLMPLGIIAIFLGWYGVAHTHYQYDQLPYVVSGGLLGLALVFLGGFLYFGAWLARLGAEQRDSARRLTDAVQTLVELTAARGLPAAAPSAAGAHGADLVLAGAGSTVHRRDCALIAHRDDLRPVSGAPTGLGVCRVCRPDLTGEDQVTH